MLYTLTSPSVARIDLLPANWTVTGILDRIAAGAGPSAYNALIDTGALITGFDNLYVAKYLLENGLRDFDAVIFLDEKDHKMALLRAGVCSCMYVYMYIH
jgi:hypothetical protein